MATAEDLMRILVVIWESNDLSRAQMKNLSEAIAKKGNAGQKRWFDTDRYKHITCFNGKSGDWEDWQIKIKGVIKSGDGKVMGTEATLKHDDCYEEMVDVSGLDDWLAEDVEKISYRLNNILINQTMGEANAVVRRCTGRTGC